MPSTPPVYGQTGWRSPDGPAAGFDEGCNMYCKICGSDEDLRVVRFWSPDDGWLIGHICGYCRKQFGGAEPQPEDYAYDQHDDFCSDLDSAMDAIYG